MLVFCLWCLCFVLGWCFVCCDFRLVLLGFWLLVDLWFSFVWVVCCGFCVGGLVCFLRFVLTDLFGCYWLLYLVFRLCWYLCFCVWFWFVVLLVWWLLVGVIVYLFVWVLLCGGCVLNWFGFEFVLFSLFLCVVCCFDVFCLDGVVCLMWFVAYCYMGWGFVFCFFVFIIVIVYLVVLGSLCCLMCLRSMIAVVVLLFYVDYLLCLLLWFGCLCCLF